MLYVYKDLYFEFGLNYLFQYTAFTYDFHFDGYVSESSTNDVPEFYLDKTMKAKDIQHLFRPILIVNYNIIKDYNIQLEYFLLDRFQLGISYNIRI